MHGDCPHAAVVSHKRNKEKLDDRRSQCDTQPVTDTTDNESKIATLTKASKRVLEHVASYTFPGGAPTNCVIIGQLLKLKPDTVRKYVDMLCEMGLLAVRCTGLAAQGGGHAGDTMTFVVNGVAHAPWLTGGVPGARWCKEGETATRPGPNSYSIELSASERTRRGADKAHASNRAAIVAGGHSAAGY